MGPDVDDARPRLAVFCEARADFHTATELVERVLRARLAHLEDLELDHFLVWTGVRADTPCTLTRDIVHHFKNAKNIKHIQTGAFGRGGRDGKSIAKALELTRLEQPRPTAVLWLRDTDGHLQAMKQATLEARNAYPDIVLILGLAHPKREAWLLHSFEPENRDEEDRLTKLRSETGHDPRTGAHHLTATGDDDKLSAKRVCRSLLGDDVCHSNRACCRAPGTEHDAMCRERRALRGVSLSVLGERGGGSGLTAFLDAVRDELAPLL